MSQKKYNSQELYNAIISAKGNGVIRDAYVKEFGRDIHILFEPKLSKEKIQDYMKSIRDIAERGIKITVTEGFNLEDEAAKLVDGLL